MALRTSITLPIQALCPVSHEPQPGSFVRVSYDEPGRLDVRWLRAWQPSNDVRDLEDYVQALAVAATAERGAPVHVVGHFVLRDGMVLICRS